jgi:hypothetical protein
VRSELDLWFEMWDRAGSQGLDTWYDIRGRLKDKPGPIRGRNVEGLDEVPSEPAGGQEEE